MRLFPGLALALCLVLAGCSVGYTPGAAGPVSSPTPGTPAATPTGSPDATPAPITDAPDPTTDRLGWEDGRWYNESLALSVDDGLNETEQRAFVARTMARVEHVRRLEFEKRVPIEVVSREAYRNRSGSRERSTEFRQFDNAKFEALFLVGETTDSIAVQNSNRGSSVLGFYSPRNESIVIIAENSSATIDELTLAHELTHALQDQTFGIASVTAPTREKYNAQNGLLEGDAQYVQQQYGERCGAEWACVTPPASPGGGGGDFHRGIFVLNFFPYSDGPPFVAFHRAKGGWSRINGMYDDMPASTEQVIHPELYGEDQPTTVAITDDTANGWARVRPPAPSAGVKRPDYAGLGQSGLVAMFAYTAYDDYNPESVVAPQEFLNLEDGQVNRSDPFDYGIAPADGWDGDRMHVYEKDGDLAYVWRLAWDSPAEAEEFATAYEALLRHWGAERVDSTTYRIADGPFADAFSVRVEGDTVTIVNAPTTSDLPDVYGGAR